MKCFDNPKFVLITVIYMSLYLDNILLTVVVPIIPDFLLRTESNFTSLKAENFTVGFKTPLQLEAELVEKENGPVGMLLSSKALIQLIINPIVGHVTGVWGYNIPMFFGTINLLIAALLYAFGDTYSTLLLARSLQGVASSCVTVAGLCLAARIETDEKARAKTLGLVLGSVALGVLSGYPLGGFCYDFIGKPAPFILISIAISLDLVLQVLYMDLKPSSQSQGNVESIRWKELLTDPLIIISSCAIWLSTSALAVLEPCLPIWLIENIKPEKWQLGTVFIPDSLGYLIGTNCFSVFAYRVGRWKVAMAAMFLVGCSTIIVPTAKSVLQLLPPHFGLGLGIGIIDAALVPMLAHLVDTRHTSHYGAVYALQQIAVSLAYSVGPLLGGEIVKTIGFPWLMRSIGIINIVYCPLLIALNSNFTNKAKFFLSKNEKNIVQYNSTTETINPKEIIGMETLEYQRFPEDDD